ncbi:transposase [Streptomyces sp. NPDC053720]|uniref:transposase n=1 Tax=Streptomyces sp. NPDC053720 TaxID=3154855 RepID=UPI003415217A
MDAGKKIKGRKRHLITDTLGLVLTVLVTAASVHDSAGGKQALTDLAAAHPSVTKVWADGGYQTSVIQYGARHRPDRLAADRGVGRQQPVEGRQGPGETAPTAAPGSA